ncbi:MAG: type III-B CRISPR module RAMP protein Cmr6, partial [Pseudonocardiaceae bacterium]
MKQPANDLNDDKVPVISFITTCATRLITGSGAGLPEVNSTIVHPVYGYPYLPGSSLKGAARAEAVRQQCPELIAIFGGSPESEKEPGEVRFFDAVPTRTERELLELDVATVHHKDYYERTLADPEPTQAPVPLPFLVVRAGVRFRFLLVGHSRVSCTTNR